MLLFMLELGAFGGLWALFLFLAHAYTGGCCQGRAGEALKWALTAAILFELALGWQEEAAAQRAAEFKGLITVASFALP